MSQSHPRELAWLVLSSQKGCKVTVACFYGTDQDTTTFGAAQEVSHYFLIGQQQSEMLQHFFYEN